MSNVVIHPILHTLMLNVCTGFWWGNLRERNHLEDPGIDGRIILKWKWDVGAWTGSNWPRKGKGGGQL